MARLRTGVGLVALVAACLIGSLASLAAIVTVTTGWDRVVLVSGSMSPRLVPGDLVFTERAIHPVAEGTVLVFEDPASAGLLTHRVVEVLPDGTYRTQGDANAAPDSTPVRPAAVVGQGRMVVPWVGMPAAWLQSGRTGETVALLAGLGLLVALSRWAWPSQASAVSRPARPRRHRWRRPIALCAATTLLLVGTGLTAGHTPSRAAFGAGTTNTGNGALAAVRLYLKTSAPGNVASSTTLPLTTTAPTVAALPNYDTNRNTLAGLTIQRGGSFATTIAARIQRWVWTVPTGGVTFSSVSRVRLWTAMAGFNNTQAGSVQMQAYDCNAAQSSCTAIGAAPTVTSTGSWSGGSDTWVAKDWNLGSLGSLAAGRVLQLRVVVPAASAGDVMFAYDTTVYPADLTAG